MKVLLLFAVVSTSLSTVAVNAECPFSGLLRGFNMSSMIYPHPGHSNVQMQGRNQDDLANASEPFAWYRDYYNNFTEPPPEAGFHRSLQQSSCRIRMQPPSLPRSQLQLSSTRSDYNAFVLAIYDAFVQEASSSNPTFTPAGAIRMAFHECIPFNQFASGRGGSRGDIGDELNMGPNGRLGFTFSRILSMINSRQFGSITVADAIHIAALVAVQAYGGPQYKIPIGRPTDFTNADICPNPSICWPPPSFPQGNPITALSGFITSMYSRAGFSNPVKAIVISSGAHTMGGNRLNPAFDWTTDPYSFNNGYFRTVMNWWAAGGPNQGGFQFLQSLGLSANGCSISLFHSDMMLGDPNLPFRSFTQTYASSQSAFFADFASFMQQCSVTGVRNPSLLVTP